MALNEQERSAIAERIRFNTEIIKLFALMIIATATGLFTLMLSGITEAREFFITFVGMVVLIMLTGIAIFVYLQTLKLLREIRDV
ncbi:MAG: hypothetical protein ABJF11_20265 [Reichenbachiella sp.]|uniref:hypothetical protein n=1 Tax=Reichenbachiella sp. TaxID=2184521 RepID=UPI00326774C9